MVSIIIVELEVISVVVNYDYHLHLVVIVRIIIIIIEKHVVLNENFDKLIDVHDKISIIEIIDYYNNIVNIKISLYLVV